ncbi:MAG: DUF4115 domain-containing protein [Proteobacteria bacterium]|nr:DUF4115 domain-containing protein [Pseudomonadota bacterium]
MTEIIDSSSEPQSSLNTGLSAGATLKARRVELGYTLDKVSAQLKLTPRQIDAIENERFDELPGNTFVRGFVRNYARFLDLPMAPLLAHLETCLPLERQQAALPRVNEDASVLLGGGGGRSSPVVLVLVVLAAFAVGVGGVVWYLQQLAQPELVASATVALPKVVVLEEASAVASAVAVESQVASVVAEEAVGAVVLNPASAPVAKASEVVAASKAELSIAVQQDSWVQVQDATGAKLVSELLKPGVVKSVAGVAPYRLKIGNAPYTQLTFRNKLVDLTTYTNGVVATFELK